MKKNLRNALFGATALLFGAISFSACSSSDDVIDKPNYNPETNTVKTAITMNVGHGGQQTRMTSDITQNNGVFRGMYNVYIYPASVYTSENAYAPITDGSSILAPVVSNQTIDGITADASNKTYSNVQVLIGTNNFLFYGRGGTAAPTTTEAKLSNGYTMPTFPTSSTTTAGISFAAQQIADPSSADWTGPIEVLTNYLNNIKSAFTGTITYAPFESLRVDFMRPGTPRAGSADAVLATVQHMYDKIESFYSSLSTDEQNIATAVKNAIKAAPASISGSTIAWATTGTTLLTQTNFPANLGLPLGAAQYQYNTTAFEYVTTATSSVSNTPVGDYVYPSELFYFTNTPLKETANDVTWKNTTTTWAEETYSGWTNAVQATSKNIALVNNVQYGVAQLATKVKCTPDNDNKLYDNSGEKDITSNNTNQAIDYQDNMFPLTGVLIGTQPSTVGWNFLSTGGNFTKCIYDKNIKANNGTSDENIYANSGSYSGANYTLVYDNNGYLNVSSEKHVNICLEFTNNSTKDFYGKDGLIKVGQKFYLIGKLDVTNQTVPTMNTSAVYYPSVDLRVFIQDYTTTAQCEISAGSATSKGSLANALSCIPDLKAVTQTIGLSVDLQWTPGLTYDVALGQ